MGGRRNVAIDDIPIANADARRMAENDLELLRQADAPGFRPHRAQLRLEVALRNGLGERETQRLRQLAEPRTVTAHWRQRARNAWRTSRVAFTAGALSAAAMAALSVWYFVLAPRAEVALELEALSGEYRHALQDGSTIVLHPGTLGRLDSKAGEVVFDLTHGFAEFEVAPNPSRRWDVTAAGYRVTVVGTRFGVRYEPDSSFQVDVQRGAVAVRIPTQDAVLQLAGGDTLTATAQEVTLRHGSHIIELAEPFASGSSSSAAAGPADEPKQAANASPTTDSAPLGALPFEGNEGRATVPSGEAANGARKRSHELGLLSRARQAVASGDHETALHWVKTHARRYPEGQLVEEREALRVEALRGLGNTEAARRAAGEFRERFPKSILSPQMPASEPSSKAPSPPR
jgi:ferric-dicitrate binding protein FerR (iron transport regulator)